MEVMRVEVVSLFICLIPLFPLVKIVGLFFFFFRKRDFSCYFA